MGIGSSDMPRILAGYRPDCISSPGVLSFTLEPGFGPFEPAFSENWVVAEQSVLALLVRRCILLSLKILRLGQIEFRGLKLIQLATGYAFIAFIRNGAK